MDNCGIPKYYLSVRWIQRSCDMALGVPFDIASYALLLSIICKAANMVPKEVIGSLGNVHIYEQHIPTVRKQLERNPYLYAGRAELKLPPQIGDYKKLEPDDIRLERYLSYPALRYDLFTDVSKQS
jgi:thymidylate synthase